MSFWDFLLWAFWIYIVIACISIFIRVLIDMFRDPGLNGWAKALWTIFLVALPFLGVIVYLIARGRSMAARQLAESQQAQAETSDYIRSVAGASPAAEIEKGKQLLDAGAITAAEYEALKTRALTPA